MSDIPLKDYIEARLNEIDKRFGCLEKNNKEALVLAKEDISRRLESMNQFRAQLSSQAATFLTRERFEVEHKFLMDKIDVLNVWKAQQEGKQSRSNLISVVAIVISALLAVLHFYK